MPPSPTLYRLAADRQYDRIPSRVASHPEDLLWTDLYGSTALHILCQARTYDRRLLHAVSAILYHAPEQVAWPNVGTWTPLHFAVEKRLETAEPLSTTLILRLIRACPQAVSVKTRTGFKTKTPFHIACEADADYRVLKAMLMINPSLASEPFIKREVYLDSYTVAENPLQVLWKNRSPQTKDKMALLLQATQAARNLKHAGHNHTHTTTATTSITTNHSYDCCHTSFSFDAATATSATDHVEALLPTPFSILHAACSVRCPRDYFLEILRRHPEQVNAPDHAGLYPLHYAVSYEINSSAGDAPAYTQFVIESLLECSVDAAHVADADGRLPLHIAVATQKTWHKTGIRELVFANPDALRRIDPRNGLLPFMASAMAATKSRLHLSTTYELLLAAPEMVDVRTGKISSEFRRRKLRS